MPQRQIDDPDVVARRLAIAQSIASMTSLVSPEPSAPSTLRFTRWRPAPCPEPRIAILLAMIPPTCVPCPYSSFAVPRAS